MPLQIVTDVRKAIQNRDPLKASDVLALCATAEQLWCQIMTAGVPRTSEHRRDYMREYMRRYRAAKRAHLAASVIANGSGRH